MTNSKKYKIGYVDEDDHDINSFLRRFCDFFQIRTLKPDSTTTIDEVISWISGSKLDMVVVDFNLKERHGVHFYGDAILKKLNEHYFNFPMFMLTSHEDKAINESDASINDVIYSKREVHKNSAIFVKRFNNKISKYKSEINKAQERHEELSQKSELTFKDEEELLNLEDFIEKVHDKKGLTLKVMKNSKSLEKLNELVDKADIILQKIDRND